MHQALTNFHLKLPDIFTCYICSLFIGRMELDTFLQINRNTQALYELLYMCDTNFVQAYNLNRV